MKLLKKGIYQLDRNQVSMINEKDVKNLKKSATEVDRLRSRVLYHSSSNSEPQHMLICFEAKSIVEVSFHTFAESFLIINGVAQYRFYSTEDGSVINDIRMSPASMKGIFYTYISPNIAHRFFPLTKHVVANEVGYSSFSSENTLYGEGNLYDASNKVKSEELATEPLIRNSNTNFTKIQSDQYTFDSNSGIAEISYESVLNLVKKEKKAFSLMPSKTLTAFKKHDFVLEKLYIIPNNCILEITLEDSIIHNIFGCVNIITKDFNKNLDVSNKFVIGPIKSSKAVIQNINSEFSIIHVVTERNI
ncbi:WbuC family cupin fold metalloprotein [Candidatus Pelagibacter sp.]|nr:WbuC family cupin fold metalloprotein [Candidatus Pelagibacter sp.]|tara:strand:+ start:3285 stop:4196 length:912 start_codon:yes stop_codon:yes gene_type:complete